MWNITPTDVEFAKEELKGRRAAIQARYEDEIQKLKAELDDIEALERVATAFAQRHNRDELPASLDPGPKVPLEAVPEAAVEAKETEHSNDLWSNDHDEVEILPEADVLSTVADASDVQKVSSRWRVVCEPMATAGR